MFKKWNRFVIDEFSSEIVILRRRLPILYPHSSTFSRNPLKFLAHGIWVKLWYHAKFQPFQSSFAVLFNFRFILPQNKSWNARKVTNEVRKGLKIDDMAFNGAYWMQKKSWVKIGLKKWNPFAIDEFSFKTVILRRRLSSFYRKCIQIFP